MTADGIRVLAAWLAACLLAATAPSSFAAETAQKHFKTPEAAAQALLEAVKADDVAPLYALFGTEAKEMIESGDPVADRLALDGFARRYESAHRIVKTSDARAEIEVGEDHWPLPIPIVKNAAGWRFDTKAGEDEIVNRRIGRNELSAIQACLAYVDAQREYYERNPEKSPLLHYARHIRSEPGRRDGLYWPTEENETPSPLGPLFESASEEGYQLGKGEGQAPFHGYFFRILEGQGPGAPGGAYSYLAKNRLIGGFALVAWPASYGVSGVMTFLVNHEGVVYQTDLGPQTADRVKAISLFDLDESTVRVPEAEEDAPAAGD